MEIRSRDGTFVFYSSTVFVTHQYNETASINFLYLKVLTQSDWMYMPEKLQIYWKFLQTLFKNNLYFILAKLFSVKYFTPESSFAITAISYLE